MAAMPLPKQTEQYQCKSCEGHFDANAFYASNLSSCKECVKASVRKNRAEKIDYYRSYDRMRYREDDERKARCKAMGKTIPMSVRVEKQRERRKQDGRRKAQARQLVARAIEKGQIKKHDKCFFCNSNKNLQAHHPDHDKPLDIFWLCTSCHGKVGVITGEFHRAKP